MASPVQKFIPIGNCHHLISKQTEPTHSGTPPILIIDLFIAILKNMKYWKENNAPF